MREVTKIITAGLIFGIMFASFLFFFSVVANCYFIR